MRGAAGRRMVTQRPPMRPCRSDSVLGSGASPPSQLRGAMQQGAKVRSAAASQQGSYGHDQGKDKTPGIAGSFAELRPGRENRPRSL